MPIRVLGMTLTPERKTSRTIPRITRIVIPRELNRFQHRAMAPGSRKKAGTAALNARNHTSHTRRLGR